MNILVKDRIRICLFNFSKHTRSFCNSFCLKSNKVPEEAIPKNILQKYISSHKQPNGQIYDKRPFKLNLKANKTYAWCACGFSKSQPLCDGTHKIHNLKIKHKPVFFVVGETKDYWLCNCKFTLHKPFCDGTHMNDEIQSKLKYFKT